MTDQNELSNVSADGEPASKDIKIKIRKTIQHEMCRESQTLRRNGRVVQTLQSG